MEGQRGRATAERRWDAMGNTDTQIPRSTQNSVLINAPVCLVISGGVRRGRVLPLVPLLFLLSSDQKQLLSEGSLGSF